MKLFANERRPFSVSVYRVMRLIESGASNPEIAKEFGTSVQVVKNALHVLYRHIGARNRAHAVAICYKSGILKLQGER